MSTVMRAGGRDFDVDTYLDSCTLPVCGFQRRGEPVLPNTHTDGRRRETSSVSIDVSDAEFHEFEKQIEDAIAFLEAEREQIRQLCDWPGVEGVELDFGIAWRDVVVQCDHLPAELVRLAGSLGLSLAISHYPVSDDSDDEPDTDDDADERPTSVTVP